MICARDDRCCVPAWRDANTLFICLQSVKKHPDKLKNPTAEDYAAFEDITNVCILWFPVHKRARLLTLLSPGCRHVMC